MKTLLDILENRTVLYAEDEAGIRSNVAQILGLFFKNVLIASDGNQAWQLYEEERPDVLIVDICMPLMDGLEVVTAVRKTNQSIPIVVLSAHRDEANLWRAVEQKISKYLTKPFRKEALLEALQVCALELAGGALHVTLSKDTHYSPCEKSLTCNAEKIALSNQESRLLEYFIARRGQTLSFEEIEDHLWGYEAPSKEAIKALIKALRKKVGKERIKNHYGIGYTLDC
ncbi:MAG: response regulator transcription factor [Campylobacterales bacterium]|nr:response regulator transcription factor [Campylobacterales bacterium]